MSESSYSRERVIEKNKTAAECLKMSNASEFISWGDFKSAYEKCVFNKNWKRLLFKN